MISLICSSLCFQVQYQNIRRGEKRIIFSFHILFIFSNVVKEYVSRIFLSFFLYREIVLVIFWYLPPQPFYPVNLKIEYHIHFTSLFIPHVVSFYNQSVSYLKTLKLEIGTARRSYSRMITLSTDKQKVCNVCK